MTTDKPLIKLSIEEWTDEQRLAIARISAQALTQTAPIFGETWSNDWWDAILKYLKVTQSQLESRVQSSQDAVTILSTSTRDIRIEVLVDLLALALNTSDKKIMVYDSRSRKFLLQLEHLLKLYRGDLTSVEKSVSQQMYYALLESQEKNESTVEQNMDLSAKKAMEDASKKKQAFKWLATGAGIIGGGALIGKYIYIYLLRHISLFIKFLYSFDRWSCGTAIGSTTSRCNRCDFFCNCWWCSISN